MRWALAMVVTAVVIGFGAPPGVAGPDVSRPYYYPGVGHTLSPLDRQRLDAYRNQLETQQRAQQLQLYQGSLDQTGVGLANPAGPLRPFTNPAIASRNLYQTQAELDRVNGILNRARTAQMLALPPGMVVKRFPTP